MSDQKAEAGKHYKKEMEGRDRFMNVFGEEIMHAQESEGRFDHHDLICWDYDGDRYIVEVKTRSYPSDSFDDFVINIEKYDALTLYLKEDRTHVIFAVFCSDGVGYVFNLGKIPMESIRVDRGYERYSEAGSGSWYKHRGAYFIPKSLGLKVTG